MKLLLLSALSGIGILCSGCQKESEEATGGDAPEEAAENDGSNAPEEAAQNDSSNAPEEAAAADLSESLDLEVVVALFGESENLEDFENKLNDPERQISNLDLNEDGKVDYLRVIESSTAQAGLVSIQAVLGEGLYQDVASFDKTNTGVKSPAELTTEKGAIEVTAPGIPPKPPGMPSAKPPGLPKPPMPSGMKPPGLPKPPRPPKPPGMPRLPKPKLPKPF